MKKYTIATLAASALAALSIGLAAPAIADQGDLGTGDVGNNTGGSSQVNLFPGWSHASQTPYGTYQNDNTRFSGARR